MSLDKILLIETLRKMDLTEKARDAQNSHATFIEYKYEVCSTVSTGTARHY